MPSEIKRKKTFGAETVDHFSPALGDGLPRAVNIHLSFEEALKLHLGLAGAEARGLDKRLEGMP